MKVEMNAEPRPLTGTDRRYKERVSDFVDSRRGKMFGVAEVVALAGSCFVLALVLFSYLYFLVPARSRISSLNADRRQIETNIKTLETVVNKDQGTQQTVDGVVASLNDFETKHLLRQDQGRMQLYDELNQLIIKNKVRNTSGPTYTALDPRDVKAGSAKSVVTKWQSFYPGINVMVTVEGAYEDIRRFIRDVERSKQFVVINQVELQRAQQDNVPVSVDESGSGTRVSPVTLQLNMATYFQRNNGTNAAPATQE
ncbi:MAG TPA: GspMb/PilO family protein [Pyrinomonadaceae bacterium]|nr:GspMb/PilO family protein [Pyrinomonadaceae bacterium]